MSQSMPRWPVLLALLALTVPGVLLTGCASPTTPGIVQTSPDTYMVTVQEKRGYFEGNEPKFKEQAIGQAMDFAESKGKAAVPVTLQENQRGVFGDWVKIEYTFRLVDKNDPRANRGTVNDPTAKEADGYAELVKLDELRKKGIITEAEFQSEKKKVLARSK